MSGNEDIINRKIRQWNALIASAPGIAALAVPPLPLANAYANMNDMLTGFTHRGLSLYKIK